MQQVYDTDLNKLLICTDPAKRRAAPGTRHSALKSGILSVMEKTRPMLYGADLCQGGSSMKVVS